MPELLGRGSLSALAPIPLKRPATLVGSRSKAHVRLNSSTVSKAHALLLVDGDGVYLRDLASRTHTFVNRQKSRLARLEDGDTIKIGRFEFSFSDPAAKTHAAKIPAAGQFELDGGRRIVPLKERVVLIGRRGSADVNLDHSDVSTAHAVMFHLYGNWYIRDLGSRTGTRVNGKPVEHNTPVSFGDRIDAGPVAISFMAARARVDRKAGDASPERSVPVQRTERPTPALRLEPASRPELSLNDAPPGRPPVEADRSAAEEQEMDDLVGTAPLVPLPIEPPDEDAHPLPPAGKAGSDRHASSLAMTLGDDEDASDTRHSGDSGEDDLIDLDEPEMSGSGGQGDERSPVPMDETLQIDDDPELAAGMQIFDEVMAEKEAPPDLELDLSRDPDVSGSGDTRSIPQNPDDTVRRPALSELVVDPAADGDANTVDAALSDEENSHPEGSTPRPADAESDAAAPSGATSVSVGSEEPVFQINDASDIVDPETTVAERGDTSVRVAASPFSDGELTLVSEADEADSALPGEAEDVVTAAGSSDALEIADDAAAEQLDPQTFDLAGDSVPAGAGSDATGPEAIADAPSDTGQSPRLRIIAPFADDVRQPSSADPDAIATAGVGAASGAVEPLDIIPLRAEDDVPDFADTIGVDVEEITFPSDADLTDSAHTADAAAAAKTFNGIAAAGSAELPNAAAERGAAADSADSKDGDAAGQIVGTVAQTPWEPADPAPRDASATADEQTAEPQRRPDGRFRSGRKSAQGVVRRGPKDRQQANETDAASVLNPPAAAFVGRAIQDETPPALPANSPLVAPAAANRFEPDSPAMLSDAQISTPADELTEGFAVEATEPNLESAQPLSRLDDPTQASTDPSPVQLPGDTVFAEEVGEIATGPDPVIEPDTHNSAPPGIEPIDFGDAAFDLVDPIDAQPPADDATQAVVDEPTGIDSVAAEVAVSSGYAEEEAFADDESVDAAAFDDLAGGRTPQSLGLAAAAGNDSFVDGDAIAAETVGDDLQPTDGIAIDASPADDTSPAVESVNADDAAQAVDTASAKPDPDAATPSASGVPIPPPASPSPLQMIAATLTAGRAGTSAAGVVSADRSAASPTAQSPADLERSAAAGVDNLDPANPAKTAETRGSETAAGHVVATAAVGSSAGDVDDAVAADDADPSVASASNTTDVTHVAAPNAADGTAHVDHSAAGLSGIEAPNASYSVTPTADAPAAFGVDRGSFIGGLPIDLGDLDDEPRRLCDDLETARSIAVPPKSELPEPAQRSSGYPPAAEPFNADAPPADASPESSSAGYRPGVEVRIGADGDSLVVGPQQPLTQDAGPPSPPVVPPPQFQEVDDIPPLELSDPPEPQLPPIDVDPMPSMTTYRPAPSRPRNAPVPVRPTRPDYVPAFRAPADPFASTPFDLIDENDPTLTEEARPRLAASAGRPQVQSAFDGLVGRLPGDDASPARIEPKPAPAASPGRPAEPPSPDDPGAIAVGIPLTDDELHPAAPSTRRWLRAKWLVPLMLATMAVASWAILTYVPVRVTVRGGLEYARLQEFTEAQRRDFQERQIRRLENPDTRLLARTALGQDAPSLPAGFLDTRDTEAQAAFSRMTVAARWVDQPGGKTQLEMAIPSRDRGGDARRMMSLMKAMETASADLTDQAARAEQSLSSAKERIARLTDEVRIASEQIAQADALYAVSPTPLEMARLVETEQHRKTELDAADAAARAASASLQQADPRAGMTPGVSPAMGQDPESDRMQAAVAAIESMSRLARSVAWAGPFDRLSEQVRRQIAAEQIARSASASTDPAVASPPATERADALAVAQSANATLKQAQAAYESARDARIDADNARRKALDATARKIEYQRARSDAETSLTAAQAEFDAAQAASRTSVTLTPVSPDAVRASDPLDRRWTYLAIALPSIGLLFASLMMLGASADDSLPPRRS